MSRRVRPTRIAPRSSGQQLAAYIAGLGLIAAVGLGVILPATLAFVKV